MFKKNTWIISCLFLWFRETRRTVASYGCHYRPTFLFYCPSNMYRFNDLERDQWISSQHCMFINEPPVRCDALVSGLCQWYCRRQLRVSLFLIKGKLATDQQHRATQHPDRCTGKEKSKGYKEVRRWGKVWWVCPAVGHDKEEQQKGLWKRKEWEITEAKKNLKMDRNGGLCNGS